jgi:hypothetical protein
MPHYRNSRQSVHFRVSAVEALSLSVYYPTQAEALSVRFRRANRIEDTLDWKEAELPSSK